GSVELSPVRQMVVTINTKIPPPPPPKLPDGTANVRIGTVSASLITVGIIKTPVSKTVKVILNGKPGKISDLKPGYAVDMTVVGGRVVEVKFPASSTSMKGVVLKVSASQINFGGNTFGVSKDVKVTISGKAGKIADLKEGYKGQVELSPVSAVVVAISVDPPS